MWSRTVILKWSQVAVNVVIIIFGMCICLPLGSVWKYFDSSCLLDADIHISVSPNNTVILDLKKTVWGSTNSCYYTTYLPVVVAIHAFIWNWCYVLLQGSFEKQGEYIHLLLPSLVLHACLFICSFVSSVIVTSGFSTWCNNAVAQLDSGYSCQHLQELSWNIFQEKHQFYTFYQLAEVATWLMTIALACQCGLTVIKGYKELMGEKDGSPEEGANSLLQSEGGAHSHEVVDDGTGSVVFNFQMSLPRDDVTSSREASFRDGSFKSGSSTGHSSKKSYAI